MIKQVLNSVLAKYRDLSMARRSIICLCLRHRQIIDLLATDKSQYFARPRSIIDNYLYVQRLIYIIAEVKLPTVKLQLHLRKKKGLFACDIAFEGGGYR